ncbi:MAG: FecR domain-containing protein [Gammaproteobacteria bacterium]|nr:FecR domain-containing protein [Gammaproteobacteria bacterium]MYF28906.1 FecR domain-containing protein [Gammaproteobacteria bacterium]MYK48096.1 FecR domain-containing protein [Gammaproteobacteria bacterium]
MNDTDETTKSKQVLDADDSSREESLDLALAAVRGDMPRPGSEAAAAQRVAQSLGFPAASVVHLTDYEALIPDYLAGRLNDAQRMLFEDEVRTSIPLRRALAATRSGEGAEHGSSTALATGNPGPSSRSRAGRRWIYALAAAIAVAIGAALVVPTPNENDPVRLARVETVAGLSLQQVGSQWVPLTQDEWIADGQRLATKQNGTAVLEFDDGSKVEVAPRSQLRLTHERGGNRIRVDQGSVIVQVAPQRNGTFNVVTDDLLVAVVGTTLGVGHGTKGSRVSVIEGEVEVRHDGKTTSLQAGDQYGTRKTTAMALEETIAWSRDAEHYAEILQAYTDFQRDIGEALTAGNRHSTRLLDLVPAETSVYVAVPNAPATIAEAYAAVAAFHDRLPAAEFPPYKSSGEVEEMVGWLGEVGDYLGPETVLALYWDDPDSPLVLLLAETRRGLRRVIEDKLQSLSRAVGNPQVGVDLIDDPQDAQDGRLSIWLNEGLFAASTSPAALVQLEATLDEGSNPFRDGALYARLAEVYERGAEYVMGADMAQLGQDGYRNPLLDLRGARTVIAEHRLDGEVGVAALEVRFDDDDPDRVALLDQPGPMGALRFFSPDTSFAGAVVLPDSEKLTAVLNTWLDDRGPAETKPKAVSELIDGVVGMLGGEIAVAVDGPLLPQPSWKAAVEVYDQTGLQESIEAWIGLLQAMVGDYGLTVEAVEGTAPHEPVYRLSAGGLHAHYAYIDGYLVLAGTRAVLEQARQTYDSGATLLDAAKFQELLPLDSYLDFSAMTYARLDDSLALPLLGWVMPQSGGARGEMFEQLRDTLAGTAVFGVYNEPDRIRVVANGTNIAPFFGLPMLPALGLGMSDVEARWQIEASGDGGDTSGRGDGT